LLQNAEGALPQNVEIDLFSDQITFRHDGYSFTIKYVFAISSDKDLTHGLSIC
jgi:hypothetical protein